MRINPETLARASSRHPWRVITVWVFVVAVLGTISSAYLSGALTNDIAFTNEPESVEAQTLIEDKVTGEQAITEFIIVKNRDLAVEDPAFQEYVRKVQADVVALGDDVVAEPAVGQQTSVITVYDLQAAAEAATDPQERAALEAQAAQLVSKDGKGTLVPVPIVDIEAETIAALRGVVEEQPQDGFRLLLAGQGTLQDDSLVVAEEDLRQGEAIGIAIALVVLVVVFGAIAAAFLPIGIALMSIPVALGIVAGIHELFDLKFSVFTQNIASMIGLAVGIDYALFIVARYREERWKGFDKLGAVGATGATASRAVLFSGLTVVFALLGMFILPTTIFRSMAAGAILVVLASIAATMTLLPALLGLVGDRINAPRMSRLWTAVAFVGLVVAAGVVGAVLGAVGLPPAVAVLAAVVTFFGLLIVVSRAVVRDGSFLARARPHVEKGFDPKDGFWDRFTRTVMARPVVFMVGAVLILGGLGALYFTIDEGTTQSAATLPDEVESKQAFLSLVEDFGAGGQTQPVQIVVLGAPTDAATQQVVGAIQQAVPEVEVVVDDVTVRPFSPETTLQPAPDGSLVVVNATPAGDAFGIAVFRAVEELRDEVVPAATEGTDVQVLVGGQPAIFTDFVSTVDQYQPWVFALVLSLSFLLLMMVFRSIVVPIKAVIMNLLSVGAAYGAIVLVFQEQSNAFLQRIHEAALAFFNWIPGPGGGFQFQEVDAIEAWLPLMLFSILFGLSMDYHVFLLSRIKEEYDKTRDNDESVAYGLRTTAGIITGAAIIMVVVFTAFAAGRLVPLQQMGFGLAVAVFLDATIVRSVLVPSTMKLLGDRNWYLPKWLQWLPDLNIEGHEPPQQTETPGLPAELVGVGESAERDS
jgi:RND superfamily putative drug exporter